MTDTLTRLDTEPATTDDTVCHIVCMDCWNAKPRLSRRAFCGLQVSEPEPGHVHGEVCPLCKIATRVRCPTCGRVGDPNDFRWVNP